MAKPRFKFKSSGTRRGERRQVDTPTIIKQPIGIKTPMEIEEQTGNLHKTHKDPIKQIKDNFRNLILTNYGERLGRPELGADLISLTFDADNLQDFLRIANIKIKEAVKKYMPYIQINNIEYISHSTSNVQLSEVAIGDSIGIKRVLLRVDYNITQVRLNNQILEISIFAGG